MHVVRKLGHNRKKMTGVDEATNFVSASVFVPEPPSVGTPPTAARPRPRRVSASPTHSWISRTSPPLPPQRASSRLHLIEPLERPCSANAGMALWLYSRLRAALSHRRCPHRVARVHQSMQRCSPCLASKNPC